MIIYVASNLIAIPSESNKKELIIRTRTYTEGDLKNRANIKNIIVIPSGTRTSIIEFNNLPENLREDLNYYSKKLIDKDCFVIYYRGKFLLIEREDCLVPKTIGWKHNM